MESSVLFAELVGMVDVLSSGDGRSTGPLAELIRAVAVADAADLVVAAGGSADDPSVGADADLVCARLAAASSADLAAWLAAHLGPTAVFVELHTAAR